MSRTTYSVYSGKIRLSTWDEKKQAEQSKAALEYLKLPLEVVTQVEVADDSKEKPSESR